MKRRDVRAAAATMVRRAGLTVPLLAIAGVTYGGSCDTMTPTAQPVFPADYRSTFTEVRDCRFSIEHGGVSIRVYANDVAREGYLNNESPLPVGSILVKEQFDGADCTNDDELMIIAALRKEEPGFDAEDADWHFQEVLPTDHRVVTNTKTDCIECHRNDECRVRDYMCTVE